MSTQHAIYWWNLENLFDIENSQNRTDKLNRVIKSELRGWTASVLDQKLNQLVSVIKRFNNQNGPDILGVCEVENKIVMDLLTTKLNTATGRTYDVKHHDTQDERGIDVAFIFDKTKYTPEGDLFSLEVMRRHATRDLVQIQLITKKGNKLVLIGNHWPSRSGGRYESEPYRMMVGEVLSYWVKRIHETVAAPVNIIAMGDFNDEPFDRSLAEYAQSTHILKQVENAKSVNYLFNLMAAKMDGITGTHVFGNEINILDQFLISKHIAIHSPQSKFSVSRPAEIVIFNGMVHGEYNAPVKFGRPAEQFNPNGFSDHLPIELMLTEV